MQPVTIMVKPVSGACNMRCRYCFYTDVMARRETAVYTKMSLQQLELLVRRAFYCADGPVSFAFQGGEPTLAGEEFFREFLRLQREYNARGLPVSNSLQTNGLEISDGMIELFAREDFLIGLSIDGDRETHDSMRVDREGRGTFDRVKDTAARLKAAGVRFNILCVVNEYVAKRPREVWQALKDYGFLQFIACLDGFDGAKTAYSLTEKSYLNFLKTVFDLYYAAFLDKRPVSVRTFDNCIGVLLGREPESCAMCGVCGRYYLVESDLGVYPCDFYVLDEWRMGSLSGESFNRLAKSDAARLFVERSLPVPDKCKACRYYRLCRNGCMRERNANGLNRWCECNQAFFDYSLARMIKIAQSL